MEPGEHKRYPFDWRRWTPITPSNELPSSPLSIKLFDVHGNIVLVDVPSVTALSWNIASQAHKRALNSRRMLDRTLVTGRADKLAYRYIEDIMASVMFSVASLEAFANTAIHQAPRATYYGPKACYKTGTSRRSQILILRTHRGAGQERKQKRTYHLPRSSATFSLQ